MFVSVNPSYFCNFRCDFCYLTEDQLSAPRHIPIPMLEMKLDEVREYKKIEQIDVYGGEIALLPNNYLFDMFSVFRRYTDNINVITNLSALKGVFFHQDVTLSVSFDFECREMSDKVMRNILATNKDIHILMLASECLIEKDVEEMIMTFNGMKNVKSVEVKPYSTNQANQHSVSFQDYEEFIKKWIESPTEKNFTFVNEDLIKSSLNDERNAFSDDHIYITPTGSFAVLEFDKKDNEFFLELENMKQYAQWAEREKIRVTGNDFCSGCKYLGRCLSEHLRDVKDVSQSCNGFKLLLDWYDERL